MHRRHCDREPAEAAEGPDALAGSPALGRDGGELVGHDAALGAIDPAALRRGRRLSRLLWIVLLAQFLGGRLTGCGPAHDEAGSAGAERATTEADATATGRASSTTTTTSSSSSSTSTTGTSADPDPFAAPTWLHDAPGLATGEDGTTLVAAVASSRVNVAGLREAQAASLARDELTDPLAALLRDAAWVAVRARRDDYRPPDAALDDGLTQLVRTLLHELLPEATLTTAHLLDDQRAAVRAQLATSDLSAPLGAALARWQTSLAEAGQLAVPVSEAHTATAAVLAELLAADRDTLQRRLDQAGAAPQPAPGPDGGD